jgi:hypothetical protein
MVRGAMPRLHASYNQHQRDFLRVAVHLQFGFLSLMVIMYMFSRTVSAQYQRISIIPPCFELVEKRPRDVDLLFESFHEYDCPLQMVRLAEGCQQQQHLFL